MNPNNFYKHCINPSNKTLIGGSSGSGKSAVLYDIVVRFLNEKFRKDLDNHALNDLHSILNDQIPVVIFTTENRYSLLLRLSEQCFMDSELYNESKIKRLDNLCKIHNPTKIEITQDEIDSYDMFFKRHKTELLIIDDNLIKDPKILINWSHDHKIAIIQTLSIRKTGPGFSSSKSMANSLSFNHLAVSDFAATLSEPVKSGNSLKIEVTVIKNRQGLNGEDFLYECKNSPY